MARPATSVSRVLMTGPLGPETSECVWLSGKGERPRAGPCGIALGSVELVLDRSPVR